MRLGQNVEKVAALGSSPAQETDGVEAGAMVGLRQSAEAALLKAAMTGRCEVGLVKFDNRDGHGAVPDCQNIEYMGAIALMRPDDFLRVAASGNLVGENVSWLHEEAVQGHPFGMPFLELGTRDLSKSGHLKVVGHEGRHRCRALQILGQTEPIPVCLFVRGLRAHDFTVELIGQLSEGLGVERSPEEVKAPFSGLVVAGNIYL